MVAVPASFAVTTPLATVATLVLLLVQVTVLFVALSGFTVAIIVPVPPTPNSIVSGTTLIALTGVVSPLPSPPPSPPPPLVFLGGVCALPAMMADSTPLPQSISSGFCSIVTPSTLIPAVPILPWPVICTPALAATVLTLAFLSRSTRAPVALPVRTKFSTMEPSPTLTLAFGAAISTLAKLPIKITSVFSSRPAGRRTCSKEPSSRLIKRAPDCSITLGTDVDPSATILIWPSTFSTVTVPYRVQSRKITLSVPPPLISVSPFTVTFSNFTVPSPTLSAMRRSPVIIRFCRVTPSAFMITSPSMVSASSSGP